MSSLKDISDHTIQIIEELEFKGKKHLFMEYENGGTINSLNRAVSEKEFWTILQKLVEGLSLMDYKQIAHRDLKPDNILLHFPEYETVTDHQIVE